jgi:pimeloyl-ACP methyl ester carboxylesterase
LVLISGLGGKGRSWEPFLSVAAQRYSTLVFDLPGCGSAPALPGPITIRDLARSTLGLLDHLGLERAAFVGRSMGGMIAQELALLAPERVSRLVLVSTTARTDPHLAEVFRLWAHMAELGLPATVRHRSAMLWCLGARALAESPRAASYLRAKARADRPKDYALQARACSEHDVLERLHGITSPTLVVSGTDDRLTPSDHAKGLSAGIKDARLLYIPEAGHLPYLEAPEEFERGVLSFLGAAGPTRAEEDPVCPSISMPS